MSSMARPSNSASTLAVLLEKADFVADRQVAVDRRQQDVPERESQDELQCESHVFPFTRWETGAP